MSTTKCKVSDVNFIGRWVLTILSALGLLEVKYNEEKDDQYVEFNNMTIINLTIKYYGPIHEWKLSFILLTIQVM